MGNYICSFFVFGIYIFLETKLKNRQNNILWFYILFMFIGAIGLFSVNYFKHYLLENFFLLVICYSGIEIFKYYWKLLKKS